MDYEKAKTKVMEMILQDKKCPFIVPNNEGKKKEYEEFIKKILKISFKEVEVPLKKTFKLLLLKESAMKKRDEEITKKVKELDKHLELNTREKELQEYEEKLILKEQNLKELQDYIGKICGSKDEGGVGANASKEFFELNKKYLYNVPEHKFTIAGDDKNIHKNRYSNVLPYNETLCVLPSGNYINATMMNLYGSQYIACQWPLKRIAANGAMINTEEDFWEMVWEKDVNTIVTLQNPKPPTHHFYWPKKKGEMMKFEYYSIINVNTVQHNYFNVIQMNMSKTKNLKTEKRLIFLCLFSKWPDHDIPKEFHPLFALFKTMGALSKGRGTQLTEKQIPPTVIHCSAGIGRTGVFIACDIIIKNGWNTNMIKEVVAGMRKQRYGMVQNLKQYKYVYDMIKKYYDDE